MEHMTAAQFRASIAKKFSGKVTNRANDLTKATLTFLNANGFEARRVNTTGIFDTEYAAKKMLSLCASYAIAKRKPTQAEIKGILTNCFRTNKGQVGVSDIIGFQRKTGRFIAVEVKVGRDKLSLEQKYYLDSVRKGGGIAIEARDMDSLIDGLREQGGI